MSDTIIMYENGKAVGGEGHPTNADEITFNNEDTDLVSEEVESAIKEVNAKFDRGSVSVTTDGVKTISQVLADLYALIDTAKISINSKFIRIAGNQVIIHSASFINTTNGYYTFGQSTTNGTLITTQAAILAAGAKTYCAYDVNISNNTIDAANMGTTVRPAGEKFAIYY
jgi:hypothetical protein